MVQALDEVHPSALPNVAFPREAHEKEYSADAAVLRASLDHVICVVCDGRSLRLSVSSALVVTGSKGAEGRFLLCILVYQVPVYIDYNTEALEKHGGSLRSILLIYVRVRI